jgi:hypothetical protein
MIKSYVELKKASKSPSSYDTKGKFINIDPAVYNSSLFKNKLKKLFQITFNNDGTFLVKVGALKMTYNSYLNSLKLEMVKCLPALVKSVKKSLTGEPVPAVSTAIKSETVTQLLAKLKAKGFEVKKNPSGSYTMKKKIADTSSTLSTPKPILFE